MNNSINKSDVLDIFELSTVQKGMLYHHLKELDDALYNVSLSLKITGQLSIESLIRSFEYVQKNNEVLRSIFDWNKTNKPLQIILKECPLSIHYMDATNEEVDLELQLANQKRDWNTRFELSEVPFRVEIIKMAADSHLLNIAHHHILYDGWSTGILLEEVFQYYHQLSNGQKPSLGQKSSYKDIQRSIRDANNITDKAFWKDYLADYEAQPMFPDTINRNVKATSNKVTLSAPFNTFDSFGAEHKLTKSSIIFSSFGLLLSKYLNTNDVVFGTTVSGRESGANGIEKVMGNFVNTIPMRLRTGEEDTLLDIIKNTQAELIERIPYSGTAYYDIKKELNLNPTEELFDAVIVIENYPLDERLLQTDGHIKVELNNVLEQTGIPLVVTVFFNETLDIELNYNADLFTQVEAIRLGVRLMNIISEMLANGEKNACKLELATRDEKNIILNHFNNTFAEYPRESSVIDLFEAQVERSGDDIAVSTSNSGISYYALNNYANQIAETLSSKGIDKVLLKWLRMIFFSSLVASSN
ncbi:MAG: condensation domain-containing protein, partial [Bacteroidota bacterium]